MKSLVINPPEKETQVEGTVLIKSPSNFALSPSHHRNINTRNQSRNLPNFKRVNHTQAGGVPPTKPQTTSPLVFIALLLAFLVFFALISATVSLRAFSTNPHLRDNFRQPFSTPTSPTFSSLTEVANSLNISVILFGDSLLNVPFTDYQLEHKIKSLLPRCFQNITILNKGRGGNKVHDLRQRLTGDVLLLQPEIVFIHFDSDVSDQDIDFLRLNSTKLKYQEDYDYILHMMTSYKIPHLAIAGPGLLGEGPIVRRLKFQGKEDLLDQYRSINQKLAESYNIPYIDIRKAYQEALPPFWVFSSGFVTTDGEHPNDRGSLIIAQHFAAQINQWYSC